ncbi:GroES-like protein, partial [Acephala macrosclerotiorum]
IEDVGSEVTNLQIGDRVIAYDGVSCGFGDNYVKGLRAYCETVNKPFEGEYFGIPFQGTQLNGGQAQVVRVPYAEQGTLLLPPGTDHEFDYLLLCDVQPTALAVLGFAGFQPGEMVAVFGAGLVGLLCAYSAILRGATRLEKARSIGAILTSLSKSDPIKQKMALEPLGVDRACNLMGYECVNAGVNVLSKVITNCINVTKPGGGIGIIGTYNPKYSGAPTADTKKGTRFIPFATLCVKGLSMKTGAIAPHQYHTQLKELIKMGIQISFLFKGRKLRSVRLCKLIESFLLGKF